MDGHLPNICVPFVLGLVLLADSLGGVAQEISCGPGEEQVAAGRNFIAGNGTSCQYCAPGFYSPHAGLACYACPRGYFAGDQGVLQCSACGVGTYQAAEGQSACDMCPAGKYQNSLGSVSCRLCTDWLPDEDSFAIHTGSDSCTRCPEGVLCVELPPPASPGLFSSYSNADGWYILSPSQHAAGCWQRACGELGQQCDDFTAGVPYRCVHGTDGEACLELGRCYEDPWTGEPAMEGRMCGKCRQGYAKAEPHDLCRACGSLAQELVLQSFDLSIIFVYSWVLTAMTSVTDPRQVAEVRSIVLKQFADYMQMMVIIMPVITMRSQFLRMTVQMLIEPFVVTTGSGSSGAVPWAGSAYCIVSAVFPNYEVHHVYTVISVLMVPAWILWDIGAFLAYKTVKRAMGRKPASRSTLVTLIIINMFVVFPRVMKMSIFNFQCAIFDVPRLIMNPDIECNDASHLSWQLLSGLGAFLLFACGIPLCMYLTLRHFRHRLHDIKVARTFGFLYDGFEPQCYYFEAVLMMRKVAYYLVMILPIYTQSGRCITMMGVTIVALALHYVKQPYDNRSYFILDHVEEKVLWAILITLLLQSVLWAFDDPVDASTGLAPQLREDLFVIVAVLAHMRVLVMISYSMVHPLSKSAQWYKRIYVEDVEVLEDGLFTRDLSDHAQSLFIQMISELADVYMKVNGTFKYDAFAAFLRKVCSKALRQQEKRLLDEANSQNLSCRDRAAMILQGAMDSISAIFKEREQRTCADAESSNLGLESNEQRAGKMCSVEDLHVAMLSIAEELKRRSQRSRVVHFPTGPRADTQPLGSGRNWTMQFKLDDIVAEDATAHSGSSGSDSDDSSALSAPQEASRASDREEASEMCRLREGHESLKAEVQRLRHSLRDEPSELRRLEEENEALKAQIVRLSIRDGSEVHRFDEENKALKAEVVRLSTNDGLCEVLRFKEETKALKAEVEHLRLTAIAEPSEVRQQQEETEALKAEVESLRSSTSEEPSEVRRRQEEIDVPKGEVEHSRLSTSEEPSKVHRRQEENNTLSAEEQCVRYSISVEVPSEPERWMPASAGLIPPPGLATAPRPRTFRI